MFNIILSIFYSILRLNKRLKLFHFYCINFYYFIILSSYIMIIRLILLILIIFAISYYYQRNDEYIKKRKTNLTKIDKIKRINSDDRILNIIYSIQGYYHYNQEAFIELIKNIEIFLELFELINIDIRYISLLYSNMCDRKKNIINTLVSFRIRLPIEYNADEVIHDMKYILDDYLKKVYEIHTEYIKNNGINIDTKLIIPNELDGYNIDTNPIMPKEKLLFNRL